MRITLYVNPKQMGQQVKNVYFKQGNHFYRSNVTIARLSDLNVEEYRKRIRASVVNVLRGGNPEKHRIENKGLVYADVAVVVEDVISSSDDSYLCSQCGRPKLSKACIVCRGEMNKLGK